MYRWKNGRYVDDGIKNDVVFEMGYRNKTVIEFVVDGKGNYTERDVYQVIRKIYSPEGETLLTCNTRGILDGTGDKRVFCVERVKNTSRHINKVWEANDDTYKYCEDYWPK